MATLIGCLPGTGAGPVSYADAVFLDIAGNKWDLIGPAA